LCWELSRSLKRRAKLSLGLATVAQALTGAVSVIQRGDSALRLNVHFHVIALDGVHVRQEPDGPLVFHPLPVPTPDEVADVAKRTALRVQKILVRHGRSLDGSGERDAEGAQPAEQLGLSACYGAAASGLGLDGERAGQPLLRIVDPSRARDAEPVAELMGFNVHAQVAIPARDRPRLERLCRYLCRPPIAQDRLEEQPNGKLRYLLKKPWKDGTVPAWCCSSSSVTTRASTTSHAGSPGPGCSGMFSRWTSRRARTAPGPCAGSRPPPRPKSGALAPIDRWSASITPSPSTSARGGFRSRAGARCRAMRGSRVASSRRA